MGFSVRKESSVAIVIIRRFLGKRLRQEKRKRTDVTRLRPAIGRPAARRRSGRRWLRAASVAATTATAGTAGFQTHHGVQMTKPVREIQESVKKVYSQRQEVFHTL